MSNPYYRFFPGDYMRDTMHLTWLEDCAYRRLLDFLYSAGRIPADTDTTYRITRATTEEQRSAVDSVISQFFREKQGELLNKKATREMVRRRSFLLVQSERGKRSAAKKKEKVVNQALGSTKLLVQPTITITREVQEQEQNQKKESTTIAPHRDKGNGSGAMPPKWTNLISWDREKGCFEGITQEMIEKWRIAYPAVNLNAQLNRADEWLKANPNKLKKNYYRFVINWLARSQERGGR